MEELKFVIKCSGTTKAVRHRNSPSIESRQSISSEQSNNSKLSLDKLQNPKFSENLNKVRDFLYIICDVKNLNFFFYFFLYTDGMNKRLIYFDISYIGWFLYFSYISTLKA